MANVRLPALPPLIPRTGALIDTGFRPADHGYAFDNKFRNDAAQVINHWFGWELPNPFQLTTKGLCGGMCYSALDYYLTRTPLPKRLTDKPQPDSPPPVRTLWGYIATRQLHSYKYVGPRLAGGQLENLPVVGRAFGGTPERAFLNGLEIEFDRLLRELRGGRPVPLGLQNVELTATGNHQVLAYAARLPYYARPLQIFVYDPNFPARPEGHPDGAFDGVTVLTPDPFGRQFLMSGSNKRWRTFYTDLGYTVQRPPAIPELSYTPAKPTVIPPPLTRTDLIRPQPFVSPNAVKPLTVAPLPSAAARLAFARR